MHNAYIIDGIRTAIGRLGGGLATIRPDDMGAHVIRSLLLRNPTIEPNTIDDVIMGCANQAGEDNRNIARMSLLLANLPVCVPGETLNRLCASGMSAVVHAYRAIKADEGGLFIAGGIENMTRAPWVMAKTDKAFANDIQLENSTFGWRFINPLLQNKYGTEAMGETAENLAVRYDITRGDQDMFAYKSQQKAIKAQQSGRLAKEIVAIDIGTKQKTKSTFEQDEFIKPHTTLEALTQLKPVFKKKRGTVTAGNASGLNDGAAALLVASGDMVQSYKMRPLVRICSAAVVGVEPSIMGIGPVKASKKALLKANLTLEQIDIIEINEAFAVQVLACTRLLGIADNDARVNPNGGAIALGHPLGMSGARIILSAAIELQKQQKRYALVAMCVGVGQGYAVVIEKC